MRIADSYALDEFHQSIANRIKADEPGLAQCLIGDWTVSYDATRRPARIIRYLACGLAEHPLQGGGSVIEEMLLDIARGEGIASRDTFSRRLVEWLIEDRRRWFASFVKKHREADELERLLLTRPQIFY